MKNDLIDQKKDELIIYLRAVIISHCPDESYENKLLTELSALQQQESEPEKSAEELDLLQYVTNLLYAAAHKDQSLNSTQFDKWVEEQIRLLNEYAHSSHPDKEPLPSDEDIENAADEFYSEVFSDKLVGFIDGAKWAIYRLVNSK